MLTVLTFEIFILHSESLVSHALPVFVVFFQFVFTHGPPDVTRLKLGPESPLFALGPTQGASHDC